MSTFEGDDRNYYTQKLKFLAAMGEVQEEIGQVLEDKRRKHSTNLKTLVRAAGLRWLDKYGLPNKEFFACYQKEEPFTHRFILGYAYDPGLRVDFHFIDIGL